MDIMDSIRVQRLRKGYGRGLPPAVDITAGFSVSGGELFGIIGPDGAGKTTLFRLLTTLISPDEGDATVQGLDIIKDYRKLRTIIGYMPGRFFSSQPVSLQILRISRIWVGFALGIAT